MKLISNLSLLEKHLNRYFSLINLHVFYSVESTNIFTAILFIVKSTFHKANSLIVLGHGRFVKLFCYQCNSHGLFRLIFETIVSRPFATVCDDWSTSTISMAPKQMLYCDVRRHQAKHAYWQNNSSSFRTFGVMPFSQADRIVLFGFKTL